MNLKIRHGVFVIAALLSLPGFIRFAQAQSGDAKRRASLEQLRRVLPPSAPWLKWLDESRELPPDFDALPSTHALPDPLVREVNGRERRVTTAAEWRERREELKRLFHQWVIGSVPPAPNNLQARTLSERKEAGATVREVELGFGPNNAAKVRVELMIPDKPGPLPVFLTQHNHRAWALIALRRGYLACVYAGSDSRDDTDSFVQAYPGYDWSRLTRRAWAASRVIDYLIASVPQADRQRIALTGHSRNGKQSLIASALDERIALVISSSSGTGGTMPARYFAEQHFGESIEKIVRSFPDWFHPRLRFFAGREHKLPVDMHELIALSAPRPCLLSSAFNDNGVSTWALQQVYLAAQRVYRLHDAEERLRVMWRAGGHETHSTVIERYLDWCDTHFGRGRYDFPERVIHPTDWEAWKRRGGEAVNAAEFAPRSLDSALDAGSADEWRQRREGVRRAVLQMLGEAPPHAGNPGGDYGKEVPHVAALLGRGDAGQGVEKQQVVFGDYINADIYLPADLRASGRKAPTVLWLHPFSFAHGYGAGYRDGEQFYRTLARSGFVVFCFDQVGFGRRIEEVEGFYERYPRWSLAGQMVRDAEAALDVLTALPYVEARQVYGIGYSLGSFVGLHLGAVDERLAGFAAVSTPPPFRLDTDERETGGIRRWSHLYMLLPRLGFFIGQEGRTPYDVPDLMASFAPRPLLVISPQLDREAPLKHVTAGIEAARKVYALYGAAERLEQVSPEQYNRLGPDVQTLVIDWLKQRTQARQSGMMGNQK
jgi:alpha/beta superfamily hydrolase